MRTFLLPRENLKLRLRVLAHKQQSLNTRLQAHRHSLLAYRHSQLAHRLQTMAQMTQIAWDGPHFGNPPTSQDAKAPETMSPLDEDNRGYKMMENMGWENGTPLGCRNEGILNPPHIDTTPKKDLHGVGYTAPLTEAQQRWNFNQLKENDRLQSAIEDYMLSNGPNITDEEKALAEDINAMEQLGAG